VRGLAELGWDVDPADYLRPGAAVIARRVLAALHPGAIVVMHDAGGNRSGTIAALPAIIRGIRAAGYQIGPVWAGWPVIQGSSRDRLGLNGTVSDSGAGDSRLRQADGGRGVLSGHER